MKIRSPCPTCKKTFHVDPQYLGTEVRCKTCGTTFRLADDASQKGVERASAAEVPTEAVGDPLVGKLVGQYRILERLGAGGMSTIYKAEHTGLRRLSALKILHEDMLRRSSRAVALFMREARSAAALSHPNIVAVHNVGEADGRHFIEMVLVEGTDLRERLGEQGRLSIGEATRMVRETAEALAAAHAQHIVHRDIKPGNILLDSENTAKVADFGLAKNLVDDIEVTKDAKAVIGTAPYMSPEQCDGKPLDHRSDIYSLGVSYFFLVTGELPFRSNSALSVMLKHKTEPVPDPRGYRPGVPDVVCRIITRAMAKAPEDRYPDCEELIRDLDAALAVAREMRESGADVAPPPTASPGSQRTLEETTGETMIVKRPVAGEPRGRPLRHRPVSPQPSDERPTLVPEPGEMRELDLAPVEWERGDVVLDTYEVVGVLGEGTMGKVYLVRHLGWERDLAVKVIRPELLRTRRVVQNFLSEIESWINLGVHANVVSCYYVRTLNEIPCIFVDHVDGGSLLDWIYGRRKKAPKLYQGKPRAALARILDIAIQIARGLHAAHETDLMHLDVRPANVMMTGEGEARLTDFALARAQTIADQEAAASRGGTTHVYSSPEQARGEGASRAADVWSWAASILHMLVGDITWTAGPAAAKALEEYLGSRAEGARVPNVPDALADALRKCLAPKPEDRWADMVEAAAGVEQAYNDMMATPYARQEPKAAELHVAGLSNRAVSLVDLGQTSEAERLLREAIRAQPSHREATFNLALLSWRMGQETDDATLAALTTAASGSDAPEAWAYLRGMAHLERGDLEAARQELQIESLSDDPKARDARQAADEAIAAARGSFCAHVLPGGNHELTTVAVSPDGQRIAAGTESGAVLLWQGQATEPDRVSDECESQVLALGFVDEGQHLLSCHRDGTIQLLEPTGGERILRHKISGMTIRRGWIDPSGGRTLLNGDDGGLYISFPPKYAPMRVEWGHSVQANAIALLAGGRQALIAHLSRLHCYDLGTKRLIATYTGHEGLITGLAISPNERRAVSGSEDGTVRIWHLDDIYRQRVLHGHRGPVRSVAFLAGTRHVVSAGDDQTVRIWEVGSGRCVRTLTGHEAAVRLLATSSDGRRALSAGADGAIRVWQIGLEAIRSCPFLVCQARTVAHTAQDEDTFLKLLQQAQQAQQANRLADAYALVREATELPGFNRSPRARVALTTLASAARRVDLKDMWDRGALKTMAIEAGVTAITPDGRFGVSGGDDGIPHLWNLHTGARIRALPGFGRRITALGISPDGARCAVGGDYRAVRILNMRTGKPMVSFEEKSVSTISLAFSQDGQRLTTSAKFAGVKLWNAASGKIIREFRGCSEAIGNVDLSPDGRFMCSADMKGLVLVWDAGCKQPVRRFADHANQPTCACFSPRAGLVLSGDADGEAVLWQLADAREVARWIVGTAAVRSLTFSPEGNFVAAATADGVVSVWQLTGDAGARPQAIREGAAKAHSDELSSLAFSANLQAGFGAAGGRGLSVIEMDWDLDFPKRAPAAQEQCVLPGDDPWPGMQGRELYLRKCVDVVHWCADVWQNGAHWWRDRLDWAEARRRVLRTAAIVAVLVALPLLYVRLRTRLPVIGAPSKIHYVRYLLYGDQNPEAMRMSVKAVILRRRIADLQFVREEYHKQKRLGKGSHVLRRLDNVKSFIEPIVLHKDTRMLVDMLAVSEDDPCVQLLIIATVAYTGDVPKDEVALPVLAKAIESRFRRVRRAAADCLVEIGVQALPVLEKASDHQESEVRESAYDAIDRLRGVK